MEDSGVLPEDRSSAGEEERGGGVANGTTSDYAYSLLNEYLPSGSDFLFGGGSDTL